MPAGRTREEDLATPAPSSSSPPPAVLITFGAAVLAGIAGSMASGLLAVVAILAAALGGAFFASKASGPRKNMVDVGRPRRILLTLDRGGSPDAKAPPEFQGEWATLFERANRLAVEARTGGAAIAELAKFRKQAELAASLLRDGKDPLLEAPELRAGPLQSLLEGVKSSSTTHPVVSHISLGEEGLIGEDGDTLPPDWPKPDAEGVVNVPGPPVAGGAFEKGLLELVREIESLRSTLAGGPNGEGTPGKDDAALRTPAQLVDAVVLTAADGIEDLAAGLMRANELASVAERVTNRATLLALNAALEATRSGSEAFAAIAEETRRLAEFAREATDTISRLSSEIEYKVGETITAIHATSEDAKTSLAEMSGSAAPVVPSARNARVQVVRLLDRSRELLRILGSSAIPNPQPEGAPQPRNSASDNVENGPRSAEKLPVEGMLLIEGLKPGAHLDS